ncbi:MAG: zinc-ribbon domain-containing protein [Candidatus Hodarchaeota archaeon]
MPKKKFLSDFPDLVKEWHPKKNIDLSPDKISYRSPKKVWWKCPKGPDHAWKTSPFRRINGTGCPFCDGKKVSVTNSLATLFPQIAKEWHPTKNNDLNPDQVTHGSGKKVWWKCPKGPDHVWCSTIDNRTKGKGCPFCVGQKVSVTNSLTTLFPQIAKEWHPTKNYALNPDQVTSNSGKKVWWKCPKDPDHEWQTSITYRTGYGTGCPYCAGRKVSSSNSLSYNFPEIAKEWHPTKNDELTPDNIVAGARTKVWWVCTNNPEHEWETRIDHRTASKSGCPYCSLGARGNLWKLWEEWCEKVISLLYPKTNQIHPNTRLPNGKFPDFNYQDNEGSIVIVDAKTNALAESIEKDIENYLPYCDRLEFWCLFKQRESIFLNEKQVLFSSPQIILSRIRNGNLRTIMKEELNSIIEYASQQQSLYK